MDEDQRLKVEKLKTLIHLWQNEKNENATAADRMIAAANKTESDLRNLQFALATFLFTFTTPIFAREVPSEGNVKILIFLAWISMLFSIVAGFGHMVIAINFFLELARVHVKKIKIFSRIGTVEEYQEAMDRANSLNTADIPSTSSILLGFQSLLLMIGFILILTAATIILFKPSL